MMGSRLLFSFNVLLLLSCLTVIATQSELHKADSPPQGSAVESDECANFYLPHLPKRIKPLRYDLSMSLSDISFGGEVSIDVEIKPQADNEPSNGKKGYYSTVTANQIVLHAEKSLKIERVWYMNFGSKNLTAQPAKYVKVSSICREETYQLLVVNLAENLKVGSNGRLFFSFSGMIHDKQVGINKNNYPDADGQHRYFTSTMFHPNYARLAFPCFDELTFKASFDINLTYPKGMTALANTEPIHEDVNESKQLKSTRFAITPTIPAHLVAFVVGEFDYLERKIDDITIRAYTPRGESERGSFALETTLKAVKLIEEYFQIELPSKKLDMVLIPGSKHPLANWGLIFFDQRHLLPDRETASPDTKSRLLVTITKELVQQWIGNLVTMESWDEDWLKEGVATFLANYLTSQLFPDLKIDHFYLRDSHIQALDDDSLCSSHPIKSEPLETPQEIRNSFDKTTIEKSTAIIRALHDLLKPSTFKEAIQHFLKTNAYKNTKTDNLWRSMELKSGLSVGEFMDPWIKQPGHPLIKVDLSADGKKLILEQEPLISGNCSGSRRGSRWLIPVRVLVSDGNSRQELIELVMKREDRMTRVQLPSWFEVSKQTGHWLKLNANFSGFYRVQYPQELVELWQSAITEDMSIAADRLNIIDDMLSLYRANKVSVGQLLKLMSLFDDENAAPPLNALVSAYKDLLSAFKSSNESVRNKLHLFGQQLFGHVFEKFGFDPVIEEDLDHMMARSNVFELLADIQFMPLIGEALNLFESEALVQPFLRPAIYKAVAKYGSNRDFNRLFDALSELANDSVEERQRISSALASSTKEFRLKKIWQWLKRRQPEVRFSDKLQILRSMFVSDVGRKFVKHLVMTEREELVGLNEGEPIDSFVDELLIQMGEMEFKETDRQIASTLNGTKQRDSQAYARLLRERERIRPEEANGEVELLLDAYLADNDDADAL